MRVTSFGSGSNGNAFLVQSGTTSLLIDAGVPIRLLRTGLMQAGVDDGMLTAALISHEHIDHVRSLPQLLRYQPVPYLATAGTIRALRTTDADWSRIAPSESFALDDLTVTPITVSHDAEEPVGFLIQEGDVRAAIFTDLGEPNGDVCSALSSAMLVVLESNYDEQMLQSGPYPSHLKRRIRGPLGHLGNHTCADLLANHIGERTADVWLAHLSEKNNRPDIARATTKVGLAICSVCPTVTTVPRFGSSIFWDSSETSERPHQASFF
jgi:phosphoribosyl 1,2-cyclic phosphodiesterase